MSRLSLFFLGPPVIHLDHHPVSFPIRKSIALLAYLSITSKSSPRDSLAAFLWPEQGQTRAHASLRHALWTLRSTGLSDWLEVDQERVGLKTGYDLDIDAFHQKLAQCRAHGHPMDEYCSLCSNLLAETAELYRGDFLTGFSLRDSAEFDNWQLYQSESLRQELAEILERLARLHYAAYGWEQALPHTIRWVAMDQLHEPAHRWLMQIYAQGGKRALALKQYEALRQILDQELGIEPDAETRQLNEAILAGRIPGATGQLISSQAPPPTTSFTHNLPSPLTPILGREHDVVTVRNYLLRPDTRLLTLIGPPGIGKTRLSIEVASDEVASDEVASDEVASDEVASEFGGYFKDGVIFVSLAPIRDPDLVAITITQTLEIVETRDWTPVAALKKYFQNKKMLLVLDNFEQVLDAAPLVVELLQACPALKILATSRAPLKISSERQYPLAPLQLPDPAHLSSIETLSNIPSIALFLARASLVDPGFTLNPSNAAIIAEICTHLDGLPLAIELAAAWIKLLSPQKLLARLSNRLALLQGGPVDLPPRQRTLRGAIDWGYDLLDPWGQTLLARLTIFIGGWTLEAAEAVAAWKSADGIDESSGDVLGGLLTLVDKSFVVRQEYPDGYVRFSMFETICEYASNKLTARGETESLQRRHALYFLELAESSDLELRGPQQQDWLILLKHEHNNLRAVLQWSLDHHEVDIALKLAGSLWRYWWMHGHLKEGRIWLEKALALPASQQAEWRARALNGAGVLARSQGDYAHARVFLEECLEMRRMLGDHVGIAAVLNSLGALEAYQGGFDQAYQYFEESLRYRREIGNPRDIAVSLHNLAMVAQEKGAYAQADGLYGESLALFRHHQDARGIAASLANRGSLMNDQGDARQAEIFFMESLSISKGLEDRDDLIECLEGFAGVASLLQQPQRAVRLFGAVLALREMIGAPVPFYKHARHQRFLAGVRAQLSSEAFDDELEIGKKMSLDEAIDYALIGSNVKKLPYTGSYQERPSSKPISGEIF